MTDDTRNGRQRQREREKGVYVLEVLSPNFFCWPYWLRAGTPSFRQGHLVKAWEFHGDTMRSQPVPSRPRAESVHLRAYIVVCTKNAYPYIYICIYAYVCMYVCMHVRMYAGMYVCKYVCMDAYVCIPTKTHSSPQCPDQQPQAAIVQRILDVQHRQQLLESLQSGPLGLKKPPMDPSSIRTYKEL